MLWGMVAASVPFIVHLLVRRPPIKLIFPAMRFLSGRAMGNATGMRLKRILLLLLRAAIPVMLALVFARGVFAPASVSSIPPAVIVFVDNSPSMLFTAARKTLLDRAVAGAIEVIRKSPTGSLYAVASLGGCKDFVSDPDAAVNMVENASASPVVSSFSSAWNAVVARMDSLPVERPKRVFVFSDFAASNFDPFAPFLGDKSVSVNLIDLGQDIAEDRAVLSVQPFTPIIKEKQPVTLRVEVTSTTNIKAQAVELVVQDKKIASRAVDMKANQIEVFDISFSLDKISGGVVTGCVRFVSPDAYPLNDSYWFALETVPRVMVGVLYDETDSASTRSAFVISNAIAPKSLGESAPYLVESLPISKIQPETLANYRAVFYLAGDVPGVKQSESLSLWIRSGGLFFIFASMGMDSKALSEWSGINGLSSGFQFLDDPVSLSSVSPDNFIVNFFRTSGHGRLDSVLSMGRVKVLSSAANATILLEYSDGVPAAIRYFYGNGSSVFFNISLDDSDSNLMRRAVFVPLLHEVLKSASPYAAQKRDFVLGVDTVEIAGSHSARSAELIDSQGSRKPLLFDSENHVAVLSFSLPTGAYVVEFKGDERLERGFSVNYPAQESDLNRATEQQLREMFVCAKITKGADSIFGNFKGAFDLNSLLIPLLFILFLCELWLANRFYRAARKSERETESRPEVV